MAAATTQHHTTRRRTSLVAAAVATLAEADTPVVADTRAAVVTPVVGAMDVADLRARQANR